MNSQLMENNQGRASAKGALLWALCLAIFGLVPASAEIRHHLVVSIPEQRLYVFNLDGEEVTRYPVSTSKFGLSEERGSYGTPLGQFEIASKVGSGALAGTVFKGRSRTGEIVKVNAKGRDPIVTRIMSLRGLEDHNSRTAARGIYIHGTPEEKNIGRPVSYGCIRMRSTDIIALYETMPEGTRVEITKERVGAFFGKTTRPLAVIASAPPAATKPKVVAAAPSVKASTTQPVRPAVVKEKAPSEREEKKSPNKKKTVASVAVSQPR